MMDLLALLKTLISFPSVTPDDAGCQTYIAEILSSLGFQNRRFQYGDVSNLWSKRGQGGPHFCFIGHTDVVPVGLLSAWQADPFVAWEDDTALYGRGAVDMKGGIAAFLYALAACVADLPEDVSVSVLLTSDEEGPADDGVRRLIPFLMDQGERVDYALVGEPVCLSMFGDTIKHGARGSLNGSIVIVGKQGHIAYDHVSPIAMALPFLQDLLTYVWDQGEGDFPPTVCQIAHIQAGAGATNIVPGELSVGINFRYSPASTPASLQAQCVALLSAHGIRDFQCHLNRPNLPYYSAPGRMANVLTALVHQHMGVEARTTVGGATSDGRFLGSFAREIVEFGPCCSAAHQVNESIAQSDLFALAHIYEGLLRNLLIGKGR